MLKKKVFIVPAVLLTMNATSVFAGRDEAILPPGQEAVSGHALIYGHAIINDHATAEETISAESQTKTDTSDTPEGNSIVTTPPVF